MRTNKMMKAWLKMTTTNNIIIIIIIFSFPKRSGLNKINKLHVKTTTTNKNL